MITGKLILLRVVKKNGLFVYIVTPIGQPDNILYQSKPTHREYVAIGLIKYKSGEKETWQCAHRFGRVDLIGKGDSRHHTSNENYYIAQ